MKIALHFQQNPAGMNAVLTVLPGHISINFNPASLSRTPVMTGSPETVLILAVHCFSLLGDFRHYYEHMFAIGGIEACIQCYLDMRSIYGGPCSSSRDPWEMLSLAHENAAHAPGVATSWNTRPVLCEMALAV